MAESSSNTAPMEPWWEDGNVHPPIIYYVDDQGEWAGHTFADPSPLEPGVWLLPRNSYLEEPPAPLQGYALCRTADGGAWEHRLDLRGQRVYRTTSTYTDPASGVAIQPGEFVAWQAIGELPSGWTLLAPSTPYDVWQDGCWVTDAAAQRAAMDAEACERLDVELLAASLRIAPLQDAITLQVINAAEVEQLNAWMRYRIALAKVREQPGFPLAITWPKAPE